MKYSLFATLLTAVTVQAIHPPSVQGMKAIWKDTFEGCGGCDPNLDEWTVALDIDTNGEHQRYTTDNRNIQLSGGDTLQLVPWKDTNTGDWSSGRVETKESWNAQPGKSLRWQASIRMGESAQRKGMWPAFWMLGDAVRQGTDWPMCGELDIFEQVNGDMQGHGTVHCAQEEGGVCNAPSGRGKTIAIPDNGFHTWALHVDRTSRDWRSETIEWRMDGQPFHTLTGSDIGDEGIWSSLAHSPFYVILNVAVGGNWPVSSPLFSISCAFHVLIVSSQGEPDRSTESGYGNMMEVEYVAVYETA